MDVESFERKSCSCHLAQRVDAILLRSLDILLSDPDIIERYNLAFDNGWKSPEWHDMPTLRDFTRFCSIARLNISKPEAIDHQAINQITSQIAALLVSPLGNAIAKPSSFSPEPMVKFYALTGLSNDQDSYTMAVAAKAACLRVALSYPKSLFIGDELSVLFRKDGFSAMVGELCATARKDGLSIVLFSQDPDTICQSSAAAMIMQNISYRITGCITSNAVASFQKYLSYPVEIIAQKVTSSKVRPTRPTPRIIRKRVPSPPRIIRETVPVKSQSKPVTIPSPIPTVEKINPFERWNQLATLGQQTIKNNGVTEDKQTPTFSSNKTIAAIPQQPTTDNTVQNSEEQRSTKSKSANVIPAVAISDSQPNSPTRSQNQTPGEWGILNRTNPTTNQDYPHQNLPTQIQIGTIAKGEIVVPMIWTQSSKNRERFAVRSQEDIRSTNNRIVFPKGTILIADVDSVSKVNKLVQHSVTAIVYIDKLGRMKQQQIPQGVILIQAEDNKPLIAKSMSDKSKAIAQQDILIGLLGAAGRAGEIFNQNQSQSSIVTSR